MNTNERDSRLELEGKVRNGELHPALADTRRIHWIRAWPASLAASRVATVAHHSERDRGPDDEGDLPPDPRHPGKHIVPATGIWPISKWGPACRHGFVCQDSKAKQAHAMTVEDRKLIYGSREEAIAELRQLLPLLACNKLMAESGQSPRCSPELYRKICRAQNL